MNTYLIFFGKSQDFTFHAFDSSKYISDFDSVIKDFDELESKTFTIDDVSNNEILSKYNFKKNDKNYSLLKLYSLGQAANGSRISGSIFGVALLSENELEISETNNAILNTVKKHFANLCLEGAKFKTSNFYNEAETIWNAIVNHKDGNYFNKINYRNGSFNTNNKVKAFYIKDIIKNSFEINNEINNTSRLYFSNDLEHLKRTQGKWGKDTFPIYLKENNQFVLYSEKPKPPTPPRETDEITNLKFENAELRSELNNFDRKYRKVKETASKKFKIASILAVVFCLSTLAFFFKSLFLGDSKDTSIVQQSTEQTEVVGNGDETTTDQKNKVNLNAILANDNSRNTLYTLLQNIENFDKTIKKDGVILSKEKKYNRIKEDLEELGLDTSFAENYKSNKNIVNNIEDNTPEKEAEAKVGEAKETKAKETKEAKAKEAKAKEAKAKETKAKETKAKETKAKETKAKETKAKETKAGETKAGETKAGETKAGETKAGETKAGETKAGETKAGETKAGETKAGGKNP